MKHPSKITSYMDSNLRLYPIILKELEKTNLTPLELYSNLSKKIFISDFINALTELYALEQIYLKEGVLYYVKRDTMQ